MNIGIAINKKPPKLLTRNDKGNSVGLLMKNLQLFRKLVEKNRKNFLANT